MKSAFFLVISLSLILPLAAVDTSHKKGHTVGAKATPVGIQITPVAGGESTKSSGLIQTEVSGRTLTFLEDMNRIGLDQLALAESAKAKSTSDEIKAVAETIGSTEATEAKEIARLAQGRHVSLAAPAVKGAPHGLAG